MKRELRFGDAHVFFYETAFTSESFESEKYDGNEFVFCDV